MPRPRAGIPVQLRPPQQHPSVQVRLGAAAGRATAAAGVRPAEPRRFDHEDVQPRAQSAPPQQRHHVHRRVLLSQKSLRRQCAAVYLVLAGAGVAGAAARHCRGRGGRGGCGPAAAGADYGARPPGAAAAGPARADRREAAEDGSAGVPTGLLPPGPPGPAESPTGAAGTGRQGGPTEPQDRHPYSEGVGGCGGPAAAAAGDLPPGCADPDGLPGGLPGLCRPLPAALPGQGRL
mmetsp:Transcript_1140/g.1494  ORF Transcript_1140/g.1494 Transcript_1140/m.1494 type:complete len:234 (-) Transcript_1140:1170-1871(-)